MRTKLGQGLAKLLSDPLQKTEVNLTQVHLLSLNNYPSQILLRECGTWWGDCEHGSSAQATQCSSSFVWSLSGCPFPPLLSVSLKRGLTTCTMKEGRTIGARGSSNGARWERPTDPAALAVTYGPTYVHTVCIAPTTKTEYQTHSCAWLTRAHTTTPLKPLSLASLWLFQYLSSCIPAADMYSMP